MTAHPDRNGVPGWLHPVVDASRSITVQELSRWAPAPPEAARPAAVLMLFGESEAGPDVFGRLPRLWLPPSNFAVTTVLGWWRQPSPVAVIDPAEVASVFRVPIDELTAPDNRFVVRHPNGWMGPAFAIDTDAADGELILWGFTAGLVSRLFAYVGWERPWDESRVRPLPTRSTPAT